MLIAKLCCTYSLELSYQLSEDTILQNKCFLLKFTLIYPEPIILACERRLQPLPQIRQKPMKPTMANTIILIGICLVILGFTIKYVMSLRGLPSDVPGTKEYKELSNKEKGDAFEAYVVSKFDKKYFSIKRWQGDKGHGFRFAEENQDPDLIMSLNLHNRQPVEIGIECKYRSRLAKDGSIEVCRPDQLERYKTFASREGLGNTFIVLGVGGTAFKPRSLYILDVSKLKESTIQPLSLKARKREFTHKNFYYNANLRRLY